MISGIRNPSPISISSPRETTTSPPAASSFKASKMAAALLFTTIAGRPQQPFEQRRRVRVPFAALAGRRDRTPGWNTPAGARRPQRSPPEVGVQHDAVALITRRSDGRSSAASPPLTRPHTGDSIRLARPRFGTRWPRERVGSPQRPARAGNREGRREHAPNLVHRRQIPEAFRGRPRIDGTRVVLQARKRLH